VLALSKLAEAQVMDVTSVTLVFQIPDLCKG
jgi:hypothetical protein